MRDAHHMNASGACSVYRQLRPSREGEHWQFTRGGGVATSPVEVGDKGVIQLPGSHLLKYLIPRDVPRSSPPSYLRSPLHGAQIPRSELPGRRVFCIYAFILFKQRSKRDAPLRCSENRQWSMPTPLYLTFQTQWLVTMSNLAHTSGAGKLCHEFQMPDHVSIYSGAFICSASRPGLK